MRALVLVVSAALLGACATAGTLGPRGESGGASSLPAGQAAHLERMVEDFAVEEGYPNLAVGVVRGRELIWQTGYGEGATPGERPDATTVFRIGSITKVITATAVLALVEDGKLSLDDEASTWIPEAAEVLSPEGAEAITIRHLISHASGLPGMGNGSIDWTRPDAKIGEADVLDALAGVQPSFTPGGSHAYSNLGVALAGLIVSRASGKSYRAFVQDRVLDPLGMRDSTWDPPSSRLAPGHRRAAQGGYQLVEASWRLGAMEPAGGLYSTVEDLSRLASLGLGHSSILAPKTLALSQTEVREGAGYGLGWLITSIQGMGKIAWHNGSTGDYGAILGVLPAHDLGVVLLMGSGEMGDVDELQSLSQAILAYLVDQETEVIPNASTTPPATIMAVAERLLHLHDTPTLEAIEEAFEPAFFSSVPKDAVLTFFTEGAAATGGCSSYELLEDRGSGAFVLAFDCARSKLTAQVVASTFAPYQMKGLLIRQR